METNANKKDGEEDLSMEEILQSIRKIIADDDEEGKKPGMGDANQKASSDVPGSDVLELTEMLKDDGSVVSLKGDAVTAPTKEEKHASGDVLSKIDEALGTEKQAEKPAPPKEKPAAPAMAKPIAPDDTLLSAEASNAATAAFKKLQTAEVEASPSIATPAPAFRSGVTVEDMVADMLRPMMKTWLDTNLPGIVERIVEREVKKLTR